jgi:hypothetical protein
MDLNYLYHRQQVSLMMADAAASLEARHVHRDFARRYGRLIDAERGPGGWARPAPLSGAEMAF